MISNSALLELKEAVQQSASIDFRQ